MSLTANESTQLAILTGEVSRMAGTVDDLLALLRTAGQGGVVDIATHNNDATAHETDIPFRLWSATVDYAVPCVVLGSDGKLYACKAASGPGTEAEAKNPALPDTGDYWGTPKVSTPDAGADTQEIATVGYVETLGQYSNAETLTGQTWIDGKPIYRQVVYLGQGANTSFKYIDHDFTFVDTFVTIRGFGVFPVSDGNGEPNVVPTPYCGWNGAGGSLVEGIWVQQKTKIVLAANQDRSIGMFTGIFEYTKTED